MNLGEFRRRTAHLPDDTDIFIDLGDLEFMETYDGYMLAPVLDNAWAISINAGQVINYEYDIDDRIDAIHLSRLGDWPKDEGESSEAAQ